jgi:selenocysteine-specific elongation factor
MLCMKVLGTAGHVDHGKSALVLALTGMNPDRLQEEIDRQMTIDLGFAWTTLPDGEEIGIVDVPGHRDFIENMLAGVYGFDAAMLVIAADEGVMPQTREHLAILDLLDVEQGVVALTKIDLLDDPEWLELIQEDVKKLLQDTSLADAPIVPVSAKSEVGLDALKTKLSEVLQMAKPTLDIGKPRLPVDRAFTISGFGTVVTGTLKNGRLDVGDEVEILPGTIKGRIRGLQTHKVKVQSASPGSRTAANISGVDVNQIFRGDVISHPNTYSATTMIDVQYRHVPEKTISLKHDQIVKIYIGAAQRTARVRVLGVDEIRPGQTGYLQLMLDEPVVAERGDYYILRRPSPGLTLGGGKVIDSSPMRRHRRFDLNILQSLESLGKGEPADLITQFLIRHGFSSIGELSDRSGINVEEVIPMINDLISEQQIILINDDGDVLGERDVISHKTSWNQLKEKTEVIISEYHKLFPLRFGMPREELKSRINVDAQIYSPILERFVEIGILDVSDVNVAQSGYTPVLTEDQQRLAEKLIAQFNSEPYRTPSVKESRRVVGDDLYLYLIEKGELIQVSNEVVFQVRDYEEMILRIRRDLEEKRTVTVAEVRDMFNTTRKYALALMEHLDSIGITRREGDLRRLSGM